MSHCHDICHRHPAGEATAVYSGRASPGFEFSAANGAGGVLGLPVGFESIDVPSTVVTVQAGQAPGLLGAQGYSKPLA